MFRRRRRRDSAGVSLAAGRWLTLALHEFSAAPILRVLQRKKLYGETHCRNGDPGGYRGISRHEDHPPRMAAGLRLGLQNRPSHPALLARPPQLKKPLLPFFFPPCTAS